MSRTCGRWGAVIGGAILAATAAAVGPARGAVITIQNDSLIDVDFGRVIKGATPASGTVTLLRANGPDTDYQIINVSNGITITPASGTIRGSGTKKADLAVNLLANGVGSGSAGLKTYTATVDNKTDNADPNDTIHVRAHVLDRARPSLATGNGAAVASNGTLKYTFDVDQHASSTAQFKLSNLIADATLGAAYTAKLRFVGMQETDASGVFSTDFTTFATLDAGTDQSFSVTLDTTQPGTFTGRYVFEVGDEQVTGAGAAEYVTLDLAATVNIVPEPAGLGLVGVAGLVALRRARRA